MNLVQKMCLKILRHVLPKTNWADFFYGRVAFVFSHKRFPRHTETLLNDFLLAHKCSEYMLQPLYQRTSCKYAVKAFLQELGLKDYTIPTIVKISTQKALDEYVFPERCVVKSTAGSGEIVLKRDAGVVVDKVEISKWLGKNHYINTREKNYKLLSSSIIVEPFVFDCDNPRDYKVFYSNGVATLCQVDSDRQNGHNQMLYDTSWRPLHASMNCPVSTKIIAQPATLDAMIAIGEKIAAHFKFVRIDFYTDEIGVYVGEITHVHQSANGTHTPPETESMVSKLILGL